VSEVLVTVVTITASQERMVSRFFYLWRSLRHPTLYLKMLYSTHHGTMFNRLHIFSFQFAIALMGPRLPSAGGYGNEGQVIYWLCYRYYTWRRSWFSAIGRARFDLQGATTTTTTTTCECAAKVLELVRG
jgi:hypothetical protein